jgi:hypothetical protein
MHVPYAPLLLEGVAVTTATIKFGQGFECPWLVAENEDPEVLKSFLIAATGLDAERYDSEPLVKVMIQASILARGYYHNANEAGIKPKVKGAEVAEKAAPKGGLAAQAKAAQERSSEPEDNTTDVAALIQNATSTDALNDIYEAHDGKNWPAELMELAKARAEELSNG